MAKIAISTLLHVLHVWFKIQNFWHERRTWLYLLAAFWKNSKTYFTTDFWPPRNRKNGRFQIFVFLDFIGISIWNWNFHWYSLVFLYETEIFKFSWVLPLKISKNCQKLIFLKKRYESLLGVILASEFVFDTQKIIWSCYVV